MAGKGRRFKPRKYIFLEKGNPPDRVLERLGNVRADWQLPPQQGSEIMGIEHGFGDSLEQPNSNALNMGTTVKGELQTLQRMVGERVFLGEHNEVHSGTYQVASVTTVTCQGFSRSGKKKRKYTHIQQP